MYELKPQIEVKPFKTHAAHTFHDLTTWFGIPQAISLTAGALFMSASSSNAMFEQSGSMQL